MQQQILIIDDSTHIHVLVKALLAEEPVGFHSAMDAEYGLLVAGSLKPDLILLDVDMPGMSGFDACKLLKADRATAHVPVIFLTSCSTTEEKVRGLELGALDYVTKPFNRAELWARVRAALRTSHLVRLLEEKALLDALTGLGNRAMFERQLAAEVSLRGRFGNALSCILVEVENLHAVVSACGQDFGDTVLRKVAATLVDACRPEEMACRYSDDEFVVIASHSTAAEATVLADRLRAGPSKEAFSHAGQPVKVWTRFAVADAVELYDRSMVKRAEEALEQTRPPARPAVPPLAPTNPMTIIAA